MKYNFLGVIFLSLVCFYVQSSYQGRLKSQQEEVNIKLQMNRVDDLKKAIGKQDQASSIAIIGDMNSDFELTLARGAIETESKKAKDTLKLPVFIKPLPVASSLSSRRLEPSEDDFDVVDEKHAQFNLEDLLRAIEVQSAKREAELIRLRSASQSNQGVVASFLSTFFGNK